MLSIGVSATGIWCKMYPEFGWVRRNWFEAARHDVCNFFAGVGEFEEDTGFKLSNTSSTRNKHDGRLSNILSKVQFALHNEVCLVPPAHNQENCPEETDS